MDKKQFSMGVSDLYSLAISETAVESTPAIKATLTDTVNIAKLTDALSVALEHFPIFATTLKYSGGSYLLFENNAKLPVLQLDGKLPRFLGKDSGGYLFRIIASEKSITLEYARAITDSFYAVKFLAAILCAYFAEPIKAFSNDGVGVFLESLKNAGEKSKLTDELSGSTMDKKPTEEKKDYSRVKGAKIQTGSTSVARVHTICLKTAELLSLSGERGTSPEAVLVPVFAGVLSARAGEKANVTADVQIDLRKCLNIESAHNFSVSKTLAYNSSYGKIELSRLICAYDKMLVSAKETENAKREAERTVESMRPLVSLKPRILLDFAALMTSRAILNQRSNFSVQNVGELSLPQSVKSGVKSIFVRDASPSADTGISLVSFGDWTYVTVRENYTDDSIARDFLMTLRRLGVTVSVDGSAEISEPRLKLK